MLLEELGKLLGIHLNYTDHAADVGEERLEEPPNFLKPATSVIGHGGPIRLPPAYVSDGVTAETELVLVFGRTYSDVDETDVDDVEIHTVINNHLKARSVGSNMYFDPRKLSSFYSRVMTFEPDDVISRGFPGAHPITPDDSVRAEVDGFGIVAADII